MSSLAQLILATASVGALVTTGAAAQLLPSIQVPSVSGPIADLPIAGSVLQEALGGPEAREAISPTLNTVRGLPESLARSGPATLLELRRLRLKQLIQEHSQELEEDAEGQPARRGILVAVNPDAAALTAAEHAGFRVLREEMSQELGFTVIHLKAPPSLKVRDALKRLRRAVPQLEVDLDHVFEPAGGALVALAGTLAAPHSGAAMRLGMIDGGVASHPSLRGSRIEQSGFSGDPQPTGHGTAVASLMVGTDGPFRGAAAGSSLFVADVYGGNRAAGSASAIVRALGWLAAKRPSVINISLVGPPNRLVQRAIQQVRARGIPIVAPIGNDGPAAPPQYPASYPGVVSVTAVDARGRALMEAGRPTHLDFAAPGADMAAALPGQGYARIRGTSFAAPLVAARLSAVGSIERLGTEARPGKGRVGRGIVCGACRVDPKHVRAK